MGSGKRFLLYKLVLAGVGGTYTLLNAIFIVSKFFNAWNGMQQRVGTMISLETSKEGFWIKRFDSHVIENASGRKGRTECNQPLPLLNASLVPNSCSWK